MKSGRNPHSYALVGNKKGQRRTVALLRVGGGHGALPQLVLQTKIHPQPLSIQHLTTHQNPSACRTPREI
jgi:hypothetical protein